MSTTDARAVQVLSPTKEAPKLPNKKKLRGTGDVSGGRTIGSKKRTASTDGSSSSRAIVLSPTPLLPKAQATDVDQGGSSSTAIFCHPLLRGRATVNPVLVLRNQFPCPKRQPPAIPI